MDPSRGRENAAGSSPEAWVRALAHEVGNRLAAIGLFSHLLVEGDAQDPAAVGRDVEALALEAGALLAQLGSLLGTGVCEPGVAEAAELLDSLERGLSEGAGRVRYEAPPDGLPSLRVERELLHHVLLTLVYGALEASRPSGSISIRVRCEGPGAVLEIEDTGRAPVEQELAHEPPRGGRELGLRVADRLLKRAGGHVEIHRERDRTRVELWLAGAPDG